MRAIDHIAGRRDADSGYPPRSDGSDHYIDAYVWRMVEIEHRAVQEALGE